MNTLRTNPTSTTSTTGWSELRACIFAIAAHTKVAPVAWYQGFTPAMHHHRRPEEVASH